MIDLRLKCTCTDGEVILQCREREEGEDISDYMNHITQEVGKWHLPRMCSATKLEYMKIPVVENKGIGQT